MSASAPSSRARPGAGRSPERRAQILDAAERAFAASGFHAASMDAIADAVGVGKPVLYRHFGSKEGLYGASLERAGQQLVERLAAVARQPGPREQLESGVLAFLGYVEEHREAWLVLHREASGAAAPGRRLVELQARMAATVAGLVEREPTVATEALAHAMVGAGEALATFWVQHPQLTRTDVATQLTDLLWPALERHRARSSAAPGGAPAARQATTRQPAAL
jgi:AcrR family transcriptional regulator